jgi:CDP-diglyceride synthetase
MKKIIDVKGFVIGSAFLLVIAGVGSWWFGIPFWQALLIGFACMVVLGLIAAFENGDQRRNGKGSEPP